MSTQLIIGYKLLADNIAKNYGLTAMMHLYSESDIKQVSKIFSHELQMSALLWLGTVMDSHREMLDYLIEQVSLINKEQRELFEMRYQPNSTIIQPFNTIHLN